MFDPQLLEVGDLTTSIHVTRDVHGVAAKIVMRRPSDLHAHFRFGNVMEAVFGPQTGPYRYLLAMPNNGLEQGTIVGTVEDMLAYRWKLYELAHASESKADFIVTIYLTDQTTPAVIEQMAWFQATGTPCAIKYYPPHKGATTNSGHGVDLKEAAKMGTLAAMQQLGVRLLGHFESVTDQNGRELPHPERAGYFMKNEYPWLRETFPSLKICIEHASVKPAYQAVLDDESGNTVCTVTPQHLLFTARDLIDRSWRNHLKCMPIVQGPAEIEMALACCTSGDRRFIAGTDTAPHLSQYKQGTMDVCASGCYTPHAMALYVEAFAGRDALDHRLVRFSALNGPAWWDLEFPQFDDRIVLRRPDVGDGIPDPTTVPSESDVIIPLGWTTGDDRPHVRFRCF
jgi:dihydroorotase